MFLIPNLPQHSYYKPPTPFLLATITPPNQHPKIQDLVTVEQLLAAIETKEEFLFLCQQQAAVNGRQTQTPSPHTLTVLYRHQHQPVHSIITYNGKRTIITDVDLAQIPECNPLLAHTKIEIDSHLADTTNPNALCFSKACKILNHLDTPGFHIPRIDLDAALKTASEQIFLEGPIGQDGLRWLAYITPRLEARLST